MMSVGSFEENTNLLTVPKSVAFLTEIASNHERAF